MFEERIRDIFCTVFERHDIVENTSIDDIDDWDSLKHVELVSVLEKEFSIKFSFSEIVELTSVTKILEHLTRILHEDS